ncbi:hypothetical protein C0J52_01955 [Blattella germanica]|nr:hypothetical protein C0J52_01955 [Blattella germanica]
MDSENEVPKEEFFTLDIKPVIEKYEELKDNLMEITSSFSNNDVHIPHILELLGKSFNIAQDIIIQEESPLYSDAMIETMTQIEWQHQKLMEITKSAPPVSCTELHTQVPEESPDENKLARQRAIESTRQTPRVGGLQSLAGLVKAKELLHEAVFLPLRFPHYFVGGLQPSNKILLYGPPGTGKTHLVNAFAAEMNVPLYSVTSTDLVSTWMGESEKLIRELFEYTRKQHKYCFIFIDEVDSICRQRTSHDTEVTRSSALLKPLKELAGSMHWTVNSRPELMQCSGATQNPSLHRVSKLKISHDKMSYFLN